MASDPFLSDPSKKRKRSNRVTSTTSSKSKRTKLSTPTPSATAATRDEEISSESESENENRNGSGDEVNEEDLSSDEEFADENANDKRRRLAKQYLENLKNNEQELYEEFDAKDLDDDILARRLQKDVAETKGFVYKFFGDKVAPQLDADYPLDLITTRIGSKNLTSMTIHYPYLYTVSKDIELVKWDISKGKKPKRVKHSRGGSRYFNLNTTNPNHNHHWEQINCIAASPDGKYVVTGGSDSRLIIWSAENLTCLKVLETRAAVNSIAFRRNSDQLYAACADLRIRTYSINQFTQLEILYGHQDNISDIAALARETCVSVGSRDKTVMFWKIAEESRLTFRGGDSIEKKRKKRRNDEQQEETSDVPFHNEGSIDVVSMVDESHFVTGSDNGNVALWSLAKKKALSTERLAHGLQPQFTPSQASSETSPELALQQIPEQQPYWITAIHAVPYTDIFITGSFGGSVKIWQLGEQLRSFTLIGEIKNLNGCVAKIDAVEVPGTKTLKVYVLLSKEHKFGRWLGKISGGRNALVSFTFDI
ncbi:RRP9 Ribosomal RNA-processing protein 9 [Candida maltosa Xu316]|uniref:Ribosomal RNA-processing protein, putative n=1 Tax=Candida maltosa (strain Xu316) TaxID=1245528 RepID=M3K1B5_CANMX|nr:Ribosomal RNA-processing protein, putative [Candida maltosa Xu316]